MQREVDDEDGTGAADLLGSADQLVTDDELVEPIEVAWDADQSVTG